MPAENIQNPNFFKIAFWLTSLVFLASIAFSPYPGDALFKILPIACLLVLVVRVPGNWRRLGVILALVFSALGDISLELDFFVPGLAAFLVAHLCYLVVFCRAPILSLWRGMVLVIVISAALGMAVYLSPHLGDMAVPVYCYVVVITTMVVTATLGKFNHPAVICGAILFVVSDSLIAFNRFVEAVPGAHYWIMVLYYSAQYLLTIDARRGHYQSL